MLVMLVKMTITKAEWSVRKSKLAEEDNCCGVVEVEEQHAGQGGDEEGGQEPVDGEQVHSRLHADLADCQHRGGAGESEESQRGIDGLMKIS